MAALRIAALLACVAALASGATTQQPESAQDVMAVDDFSPDAAAPLEIQNEAAGHNLAARGYNNNGGGKNKYYYSYTYCYKWRGSCHYPYYYDQDYASHRCSLYENTYYKPCYEVCCDYQPSVHGGSSGYN